MTDVHPRWDSTGEEQEAMPPAETARVPVRHASASRLPGAFIGILIVLALLLVFSGLPQNLLGPRTGERPAPAAESGLPPPAAAQREKSSRARAPRLAAQAIGDEEIVEEDPAADPGAADEPDTLDEATGAEDTALAGEEDATDESIPRNPYTVDGGTDRTLDPYGRPLDETGDESLYPAAEDNPLSDAPDYVQQPQSGPVAWLAVFGSLAAMAFVGWKSLRMRSH